MEKRIGSIFIAIENRQSAPRVNELLGQFPDLIIARQGINLEEDQLHIISVVVRGSINQINSLTGRLGRIPQLEVKNINLAENQKKNPI